MSHIFISYKSQERQYALAIHDKLIEWGYDPWLDVKRLKTGGDWAKSIDDAIKSSAAMVGVMTPLALGSIMVTNEWRLAIARNIPFLPLLHAGDNQHYLFYHLQYIDFCADDKTAAFGILKTTLATQLAKPRPAPDKIQLYLQSLYDHVTSILQQKIIKRTDNDPYKPLDLTTKSNAAAVAAPQAPDDDSDMFSASYAALGVNSVAKEKTPTEFQQFNNALAAYAGRLLLLGEPGAGKTITLLNAVQDAVVARMLDERRPLPLYGVIATWKSEYEKPQSLTEWLAAGYKKFFSQPDLATIISEGSAFLLLDGLDELGTERLINPEKPEEGSYDPRLLFIQQLPENNQILITCRKQEYDSLGEKIKLNGAVTLQPLADAQLWDYLKEMPELRDIIRADEALKKMAQTPLLLSFIAFAFRDAPQDLKQRGDLSETQLRNFIFDRYVDENYQRYLYRERKDPAFTLQEVKDVLGHVAMINASVGERRGTRTWELIVDNVLEPRDFREAFETLHLAYNQIIDFLSLAQALNLIVTGDNQTQRFIHLLSRDYFAYQYSLPRLEDETLYIYVIEPSPAKALGKTAKNDADVTQKLIDLLNNQQKKSVTRRQAAWALGKIGGEQAVQALIVVLNNRDDNYTVRQEAAEALGDIGGEQAVQALLSVLHNQGIDRDVLQSAAWALLKIGSEKALIAVLNNQDDNYALRERAADALVKIGSEVAMQALLAVLTNRNYDRNVRANAAKALGAIGGEQVVQALIIVLTNRDDDRDVRRRSAKALGNIGGEQAVQALINSLSDETRTMWWRICDIAAESLERIGTPEALEAVRQWREGQT